MTFLDTDICIAILRGKEPSLEERLQRVPISKIALPSIVVAELWVGVQKSMNPQNAERKLEIFLQDIPTIPFEAATAKKYGEIRTELERKGITIGANDLLIAATALENGARLVTRNHREYARVEGLTVDVW